MKDIGNLQEFSDKLLCVAPMMAWTDRHCRTFHRLIAPHAWLYTEMIIADAICFGRTSRLLEHGDHEQPVVLQLGGNDPLILSQAALAAETNGFDAINLNVGCPSDRVRQGAFGACLMLQPKLVAECIKHMCDAVSIPVTVKCRLGVDNHASYGKLADFVGYVSEAGARLFVVHARKAILTGLTPAQNRDVPPLDYSQVRQLKSDFASLSIVLNGGLNDTATVKEVLSWADGVMIGRAAYRNPVFLRELDAGLYPGKHRDNFQSLLNEYMAYMERELHQGTRLHEMTRHLFGLFSGLPGARQYRRYLSEHARLRDAGVETFVRACSEVERRAA